MKVAFVENTPMYQTGETVLYTDNATFQAKVGIIGKIKKHVRSDSEKESIVNDYARKRPCCGRKDDKVVRQKSNDYRYEIDGVSIWEHNIKDKGLEPINNYISQLNDTIKQYSDRIERAADELGYN